MTTADDSGARFDRLVGFLKDDPENLILLADAADAALAEGRYAEASDMIDRHARIAPPPPSLINGLGLCALAEGRHADAARIFESLASNAPDDAGLRVNLAWARAGLNDHAGVVEAIQGSGDTAAVAALKARALHHLGRLDEVMEIGEAWSSMEGSPELWGVLASAALDAEDTANASIWAERAGDTPDGAAARGVLALASARTEDARRLFEQALAVRPDFARGMIGLGAVQLGDGQAVEAARHFDRAAGIFEDHLGTWIAAGWAWLIAGDAAAARERFQRAVDLDESFGEGHGGLAVLAVLDGNNAEAERRAELALRLDRQGLGGALARSLLLEQAGQGEMAASIRERALNAPVGPDGKSIAQIVALAASRSA